MAVIAANASVGLGELSEAHKKGLPRYPIPAILLSRLAVDECAQGTGLGRRLMADFFRRVSVAAQHSGVAFVIVDAKDPPAAELYQQLGFVPSFDNVLRLVLPTATLLKAFKQA
ncbi:GNAT family N-acetyltransferase [Pseudomonas sp. NPDC007930]|uniref:GNAT family N-acetyltransferase n=1 Tax=Pseudomonas sp. NPDC007930 TaxID=3364417 RepID=UPI0036E31AD6